MDSTIKQRLIGAAVLAALAIIFLPMLLKGPDVREPDAEVPLAMPAAPTGEFETRELPLTTPDQATPATGVLGMAPAPADSGTAQASPAAPSTEAAADAQPPATPPSESTAAPAPSTAPLTASVTPASATPPTNASASDNATASTGAGDYAVNIGSFSNLDNAKALAAKLRADNLPVKADKVTLASGPAMRLRVGPYADRATAEAARLRAEAVTGGAAKVIVLDADAVAAAPAKAAAPAPVNTSATSTQVPAKVPAPATPAAAPATAKAAAVTAGFAVQLSAPSVETEALALRNRARELGFNSFVQRVETEAGVRFRVRVGPVADRAAAEAMRDAVNGKLGTKGIVVGIP